MTDVQPLGLFEHLSKPRSGFRTLRPRPSHSELGPGFRPPGPRDYGRPASPTYKV